MLGTSLKFSILLYNVTGSGGDVNVRVSFKILKNSKLWQFNNINVINEKKTRM